MESTRTLSTSGMYLGADLTDGYAKSQRPIDVCGLSLRADGRFEATFWQWRYASEWPSPVETIAREILAARGAVLDGPQALAAHGRSLRECERVLSAAGKTGDDLPSPGERPFDGYIRTSIELFSALHAAGVPVSAPTLVGGVSECYPGANWRRLTGRNLPAKTKEEGRRARRAILEALGVALPPSPTHDQLDACLGAAIAAAADGKIGGASVERVGDALQLGRVLREGQILLLALDATVRERAAATVDAIAGPAPKESTRARRGHLVGEGMLGLRVTSNIAEKGTRLIAAQGVHHLEARSDAPVRVALLPDVGSLWLGDSAGFWEVHQERDPEAKRLWKKLFEELDAARDETVEYPFVADR